MKVFKYLIILCFILNTEQSKAQFNGLYYAYTNNCISKKEIRNQVNIIISNIDSLKSTTSMELKFTIQLCVYYNDKDRKSKKWDKLKNSFYEEFKKKIDKDHILVLVDSKITSNFITQSTHLFIGPFFY